MACCNNIACIFPAYPVETSAWNRQFGLYNSIKTLKILTIDLIIVYFCHTLVLNLSTNFHTGFFRTSKESKYVNII